MSTGNSWGTRKNPPVSNYLRIIVFVALSGHTIGGELLNLYIMSNVYDKILHLFGIYSFCMLAYIFLGLQRVSLYPIVRYILVIAIGLSLGMDQLVKPAVPALF